MVQDGFDIIGDIHGCASLLEALLVKLGYVEQAGVYRFQGKATRQVIFLGDIIDRGPEIVETLQVVKAMVDADQAKMVLGNHEFNAIAYFTPKGDNFLRQRTERSQLQMQATLHQFSHQMDLFHDYVNWFKQLPLFMDLGPFRAVHACWDQKIIDQFLQLFGADYLTPEVLSACLKPKSEVMKMIKRLTSGINLDCPNGVKIVGHDGYSRKTFRAAFWKQAATTYDEVIFQPAPIPQELGRSHISSENVQKMSYYGVDEKPLFVGHYWLQGEFSLVAPNIACLDYSAVSGGKLIAYQFNHGDEALHNNQYVAVDSYDASNKLDDRNRSNNCF